MLGVNETIRSRQNPTVKRICSLLQKKGRREEGLFRLDGSKLFSEALACGIKIRYVAFCEEANPGVAEALAQALSKQLITREMLLCVSADVFEKMSEEKSPEGIVTVAQMPSELHKSVSANGYSLPREERILIAESLRDPGNLGTVIRSCAALGIERLIISDDCADLYSPKTVRAAMGGLFRLRIDTASDLPALIGELRSSGRKIYATALHSDAKLIGQLPLERGDCFVIGNEGHGLSDSVIAACTGSAIIPMTEGSESLNAAAAAAICIWETVKA